MVKELDLRYYIGETILFAIYIHPCLYLSLSSLITTQSFTEAFSLVLTGNP